MALVEFQFIDEAVGILHEIKPSLTMLSVQLEQYFEQILNNSSEEYLNIKSRVKDEESLREKIIRNRYLNKFNSASDLINQMSDLIGIRLECRFIEDESRLYRTLKEYFSKSDDGIYYYNVENPNVRIRLDKKQPRRQKNGFEIYRIDGYIIDNISKTNFEIQIKALVNIFWSEIEHKIIYKNNTYLIADRFLNDMMASIRSNLIMMDNQLLSIYKNFKNPKLEQVSVRHTEFEKFLAKITYETFSMKMKESIGFVIDFKKPCETILSYTFSKRQNEEYSQVLISELSHLSEISKKDIDFKSKIKFEEAIEYSDIFTERLGLYMITKINREFTWNLFFRILFELEPENNKGDFENFLSYVRDKIMSLSAKSKLYYFYGDDASKVISEMYSVIAKALIRIDSVEILYSNNLDKTLEAIDEFVNELCLRNDRYELYCEHKEVWLENLQNKVIEYLNM